jgi:hypothetical protein
MTNAIELREWISSEMRDVGTSWSVGTFGAIAEFSRDQDEPATVVCDASRSEAVTSRGGIRIDGRVNVRPVAYETTNRNPDSWSHAIALCLPIDDCAMNRRSVLTEVGPDGASLRDEDRSAVLFDLGLGTLQVDVCVRTSDTGLLEALRTGAGKSVFDHSNLAMMAILRASPHRVFVTRVGRAEVFQAIPAADQKSPDGPHTHVLPKLLRARRTHSANNPIPDGWAPCAHLYPAHPAKDVVGHPKPFDRHRHERFQEALRAFGDPELVALKQDAATGVRAGREPAALATANGRFGRAAVRVALRQMQAIDGAAANLRAWRQFHDRVSDDPVEEDEQAQHA